MPSSVELIPVKCRVRFEKFDLVSEILEGLERNRTKLRDCDILVVSSKFASVSEGRFVELSKVKPERRAKNLAKSYDMQPAIVQLVLEESQLILGGIPGFLLALNDGVLAPNAGIDLSNAPKGWAILYPNDPKRTAQKLQRNVIKLTGGKIDNIGVILSDSRVTPTRLGTVGVAIAVAGMRPTIDMRGSKDLFANTLKVTLRGLADQIASAAEICMGEANESIPLVLVRGVSQAFEARRTKFENVMTISPEKCLIISGLKNKRVPSSL